MNGCMSAEEHRAGDNRLLCTVCLKKLKFNLKFDVSARFKGLIKVCNELGFTQEANMYKTLINAGIPKKEQNKPIY